MLPWLKCPLAVQCSFRHLKTSDVKADESLLEAV